MESPPGILHLLGDEWVQLLTFILNCVFFGEYPDPWNMSRIHMIYKKSDVFDASNYRGISIASAIPTLYDSILNDRFTTWYTPLDEQAGAQVGSGCAEQFRHAGYG